MRPLTTMVEEAALRLTNRNGYVLSVCAKNYIIFLLAQFRSLFGRIRSDDMLGDMLNDHFSNYPRNDTFNRLYGIVDDTHISFKVKMDRLQQAISEEILDEIIVQVMKNEHHCLSAWDVKKILKKTPYCTCFFRLTDDETLPIKIQCGNNLIVTTATQEFVYGLVSAEPIGKNPKIRVFFCNDELLPESFYCSSMYYDSNISLMGYNDCFDYDNLDYLAGLNIAYKYYAS